MDLAQTDHLKAYGIVFLNLEKQNNVDWILNYRGGSFLMDYSVAIERECKIRGVYSRYNPLSLVPSPINHRGLSSKIGYIWLKSQRKSGRNFKLTHHRSYLKGNYP